MTIHERITAHIIECVKKQFPYEEAVRIIELIENGKYYYPNPRNINPETIVNLLKAHGGEKIINNIIADINYYFPDNFDGKIIVSQGKTPFKSGVIMNVSKNSVKLHFIRRDVSAEKSMRENVNSHSWIKNYNNE